MLGPLRSPTNKEEKILIGFNTLTRLKNKRFKMAFKMEEGAGERRNASASPAAPDQVLGVPLSLRLIDC